MSRKIVIVTGSRAEYGLLRWVMQGIDDADDAILQVIVTGMHLTSRFGETWQEIENDGFSIDRKIDMQINSDTPRDIVKSMGRGMTGFAEALEDLNPDLMVVLGDRFEILSAVTAALIIGTPVAHLHGGEATEGAIDESIRHAVTKLSHLHFVAAEEYRQRVIQLGEHPDRVFLVGGLGVDSLSKLELLEREELELSLDLSLGKRNLLVTYHPVTTEKGTAHHQMNELLAALDEEHDTHLIFTMPNADAESSDVFKLVDSFVATRPHAWAYTSLGQLRYLSCIRHVDGVVGNSSSGLCEVPSFRKGTINIGDRQRGRLKAQSVIDCDPERASIKAALRLLYSAAFQENLANVVNPYGEAGSSEKIVDILRTHRLDGLLKKRFFNLKWWATEATEDEQN